MCAERLKLKGEVVECTVELTVRKIMTWLTFLMLPRVGWTGMIVSTVFRTRWFSAAVGRDDIGAAAAEQSVLLE